MLYIITQDIQEIKKKLKVVEFLLDKQEPTGNVNQTYVDRYKNLEEDQLKSLLVSLHQEKVLLMSTVNGKLRLLFS